MHMSVSVYLQLPEDAACVSVVVVSEWDVLHATAVVFQVTFHVFEEPGLKVQTYPVDLMEKTDRKTDVKSILDRTHLPLFHQQLASTKPAFFCISITKLRYLVPGTFLVSPPSRFQAS